MAVFFGTFWTWLFLIAPSLFAQDRPTKVYSVDRQPLQRHPELSGPQYELLQDKFDTQALTIVEHSKRIKILKDILKVEREWWDGYWLLAAESFVASSYYKDPSNFAEARQLLDDGMNAAKVCLGKRPEHPLCKFFYASNLAKISAIDGIIASLKHGPLIHQLWTEVLSSGYDLQFRPSSSLQGSVRYGMGLFHRLVPDLWIVNLIFGIRGNIDTSIQFHREGLALDREDPCARMMLATALLCKNKGQKEGRLYGEAKELLEIASRQKPTDFNQQICVKDAPKILAEPKMSCGYTQAKFQEQMSEKDFSS